MPEYIRIPDKVFNQDTLIRYISDSRDIAPSEVWDLMMRVTDLRDEAFKEHPTIIARNVDGSGCSAFKLNGKNKVPQGKFFRFKKDHVVALFAEDDRFIKRKKRIAFFHGCQGVRRIVA